MVISLFAVNKQADFIIHHFAKQSTGQGRICADVAFT
jgi:hypothetical protein